jgi:hypothetical protein
MAVAIDAIEVKCTYGSSVTTAADLETKLASNLNYNYISLAAGTYALSQPIGSLSQSLCSESCSTPSDGDCDEYRTGDRTRDLSTRCRCSANGPSSILRSSSGGPGSEYASCILGSDCTDCGTRTVSGPTTSAETCSTSSDGDCDEFAIGEPNS